VQIWQQRNSAWTDSACTSITGTNVYGKAKVWLDGKLILRINRGCSIGLTGSGHDSIQGVLHTSYIQNMSKEFTQWVDDVAWANGFVDPKW
jgi:hypothetical protein